MNILHIIPAYYPAFKFGGPIQSVHLLNKALVKKGIKVDVLTTNAGLSKTQSAERKPFDSPDESGQAAQGDKNHWNDVDGVRVKYLDFVGYEHYIFSFEVVKRNWKNIIDYGCIQISVVVYLLKYKYLSWVAN